MHFCHEEAAVVVAGLSSGGACLVWARHKIKGLWASIRGKI